MAMEANFDGLIGPTHNYGGLSDGNLASSRHKGLTAYPREAALQGLRKMRHLHDSGIWQGVLPPQQRPFLPGIRAAGFCGDDVDVFNAVWKAEPQLARNMMSASSMWAANAAMVSPSADTRDGKLHLTPANLSTMLHRSIEHEQTGRALKAAFPFARVHSALPGQAVFADEGAANHVRLCAERGAQGVEILVFGRDGYSAGDTDFPARQTRQSCDAIARAHDLDPARVRRRDVYIDRPATRASDQLEVRKLFQHAIRDRRLVHHKDVCVADEFCNFVKVTNELFYRRSSIRGTFAFISMDHRAIWPIFQSQAARNAFVCAHFAYFAFVHLRQYEMVTDDCYVCGHP
mgnify:CR=1 FL=1